MAYLSPEQITGQVLLNMHVNNRDQLVTSSNLDIKNLEYSNTAIDVVDRGKIYSKCIRNIVDHVTLPSLDIDKLMNNVTEFTFAGWLRLYNSGGEGISFLDILNDYLLLGTYEKRLSFYFNSVNQIKTYSYLYADLWTHIAIVSHNRKIMLFINGSKQIDVAYQEYTKTGTELLKPNLLHIDDICLILNQAVWTTNFTPPIEPLLGDLKYKTVLCPKNAIIADSSDLMVKLY